jgi:hypothetical protein
MSWQRRYDFQSGTRISSNQVDEEFDQLIAAVNQIQSDDVSKDIDLRSKAQMTKLTTDLGTPKLSISDTSKDLLNELINLGVGLHTFYCIAGAKNNPTVGKPLRGVFHQTGTGFGWIYAQDSNGDTYKNYLDNSTWKGWKGSQTVLWSGAYYLKADQTITPTKKLSQCNNGWILVFSDFDTPSTTNDYDFTYIYIPKFIAANHNAANHLWAVPQSPANIIVKRGNVYDDKIVGHDDNTVGNGTDVVLRYVLEW